MTADVLFSYPRIAQICAKGEFAEFDGLKSLEVNGDSGLLVVLTAHSAYFALDFTALQVPLLDAPNIALKSVDGLFSC